MEIKNNYLWLSICGNYCHIIYLQTFIACGDGAFDRDRFGVIHLDDSRARYRAVRMADVCVCVGGRFESITL